MLSAEEARDLDRLMLAGTRSVGAAAVSGLRQAPVHGAGFDFHDYRHYEPGDDPRRIDWTLEARHRQLVVRLSRAEGHARLHVLIDVSRSMTAGLPSKLACATKVAAALSYVAISRREAAGITTFDDACRDHLPAAAGRPQLFRIFDALAAVAAGGGSALDGPLTAFGNFTRGPGLVAIVSDFFQPELTFDGAGYLLRRGLTPAFVQVLSDDELQPSIADPTELVDIESPGAAPILVTAGAVRIYRERLADLTERLGGFCLEHRLPFVRLASSTPFQDLVASCAHAGLLSGFA